MEKETKTKEDKKEEPRVIDEWNFKIPECCSSGWENCPHVAPKLKKIKKNIAL